MPYCVRLNLKDAEGKGETTLIKIPGTTSNRRWHTKGQAKSFLQANGIRAGAQYQGRTIVGSPEVIDLLGTNQQS